MSETILDHGYIPEEHAPDPVISHGDPTAPGKIGIWLFLASEIMFFVAILGTYIVLRSGSPHLFSSHATALSKPLGALNTLILIGSSLTMALAVDAAQRGKKSRVALFLLATFLCAAGFLGVKAIEYTDKIKHHTILAKAEKGDTAEEFYVYDGHWDSKKETATTVTLHGFRMPIRPRDTNFDIHLVSEEFVEEHPEGIPAGGMMDAGEKIDPEKGHEAKNPEKEFVITKAGINSDINYGPWKNIFFTCYWTLTGIHGVHIICGMIPILILAIQSKRGKLFPAHTEYVGLYWHFVDLVWIFLFPLLYLI